MVLDEAVVESSDTFSDDRSPTSDNDPYSTTSQPGRPNSVHELNIRLDQLPSPLPVIGTLTGYSKQNLARLIGERVGAAARLLKRPLTQDEANAISYHTAKAYSIGSWGTPVGLAGAFYRARATQDSFRYPFFTPDPAKFNPDVLGNLPRQQARTLWQISRYSAYGLVGMFIGKLVVGGYAATVAAVGEQQDPRLRDLIDVLRRKARESITGLPQPPNQTREHTFGQRSDPTGQGETTMSGLWKEHRSSIGARDQDDMSPTSGNYGDFDSSRESSTSIMSDDQMRGQEVRQRPDTGRNSAHNRASTYDMEKVASRPRSFDQDDASPNSGAGPIDDSSSSTGSVWEQLRSGARSPGSSTSASSSSRSSGADYSRTTPWAQNRQGGSIQSEQRDGSTVGDSFAFSRTEEERQLAKTEAQKDFDARLERERRGEDFSGGEDRSRRW